jgi:Bax protein
MINNYRNTLKNLKTLFLLFALFTVSSLVSSASLSSFKPSFDSIESTVVRKEVFFNYLLPVIHKKNAEIVALRNAISNNELNDNQLNDLAKKYRVETPSKEELLKVIDILPPSLVLAQAANESDWGRSRFAKDFNNYFGIWCFSKGCGVIPKDRDEDATHEVASFKSLEDCIDYYVLNINRSYAYEDLRLMRKNQRENLQPITGTLLAEGLGNYAFPGDEYIESIQTLINFNQLERHDFIN